LDSPEQRRTPQQPIFPQIAPLNFGNVAIPPALPLPGNVMVPDDPFALPPQINLAQPPPVSEIFSYLKLKLI
jgi:hypothetical protein